MKQPPIPLGSALVIIALMADSLVCVHSVKAQTLLPARFSYAAKFVCGSQAATAESPPAEPPVQPGNYSTVINLHNPSATTVSIQKKIVLAAPETSPKTVPIAPTKRFQDSLLSDHGMSIDCTEIVNLLKQNGTAPTASFIDGWLVVDSFSARLTGGGPPVPAPLDVIEVTTTASGESSTVNSHEVTIVPGRQLQRGTWPF